VKRAAPSRGGRPSRERAEQLADHILDAATDLFLSHGYGVTSIEEVARRARVSKRTLYHRFEDKEALFAAVVHRIVEQLRPSAGTPINEGTDLPVVLRRVARLILDAAIAPQAIALHRLIVGESGRFPRLAAVANKTSEQAVTLIGTILERELRERRISIDDPAFAARQFLYMVVAAPQRAAMGLGAPMSARQLREWPADVVKLFLDGCRRRP
jgi:TetR/AcrR family transcriptional regulator, mexJK operon transcriptional repressor